MYSLQDSNSPAAAYPAAVCIDLHPQPFNISYAVSQTKESFHVCRTHPKSKHPFHTVVYLYKTILLLTIEAFILP